MGQGISYLRHGLSPIKHFGSVFASEGAEAEDKKSFDEYSLKRIDMAKKSYPESISQAKVMIDGLMSNSANPPKGIDEAFVTTFTNSRERAISLNSEQEKLKADLKTKTAELDAEVAAMMKIYSEAKKRVKMDFPQEQWREFGIQDKR